MPHDRPPAGTPTVLLTGAFGGVGEWLIHELRAQGHRVACFDKPSPANRAKARRLAKRYTFATVWGDITDGDALAAIVADIRPDLVVHAAAVIPPLTFKRPELGEAVNVAGTRALVAACAAVGSVRRMVLVSSYSVHGPSNPHRDPAPWTGDTPVDPQDDYARQKVAAERIVADSALEWTVVRLCAVFPLTVGAMDPDTLRFSFVLPYDRREHAIDVRDAALAIANAAVAPEAARRTFDVGGGDGWRDTGGALADAMMRASGLPPIPRAAYRRPDPAVDGSWYYENWIDTAESERVLRYQRHSFAAFLGEKRRQAWAMRLFGPLIAPLVRRALLAKSPYHGTPQLPDGRPFADAARDALRPR